MEKMSDKELEILKSLQAKHKRIERAEKQFWKDVDERKDDVINHLNLSDCVMTESDKFHLQKLSKIAGKYNCSITELLDYIETERQINYYKNNH